MKMTNQLAILGISMAFVACFFNTPNLFISAHACFIGSMVIKGVKEDEKTN